jgi:hypothetical protein
VNANPRQAESLADVPREEQASVKEVLKLSANDCSQLEFGNLDQVM